MIDQERFEANRREVLDTWETGVQASDLRENAAFLVRQPSFPALQQRVCRGWSTTHPELLPELKARGKTVLVISHDDRFYEVGDSIVKLDYGKIVYDQPVVPALAETSVQFSSKAVAS